MASYMGLRINIMTLGKYPAPLVGMEVDWHMRR